MSELSENLEANTKAKKKRRGKPQDRNQQKARASQLNIKANTTAKYPFLYDLNLDNGVVGKVSRLLDSIVSGSSQVHSTPLFGDYDIEEILGFVDNIFKNKRGKINDTLLDIELKQRDKSGPRSIALPWDLRRDSITSYFGEGNDISLDSSIKYFNHKGSLQPISKESAVNKLKNNTNAGLPSFTKKSLIKDQILLNWDQLMLRNDPCVLFTRTQENNKTRGVWGYPAINSANEMRFYSPLLEYQKKLSWRAALNNPDLVSRRITNLILSSRVLNKTLMSVDFSAYDASVKFNLQKASFNYIKELFNNSYGKEIDNIMNTFNTIGIITPDGVLKGKHGVPSGSTFTNEIDSIAQYIVAMNSGCLNFKTDMQIQGDDGVYSLDESLIDNFTSYFNKCGLSLNKSKSAISKDYCLYLQNLYHIDYINDEGLIPGIYPIYRAMNKILYQERFTDFKSVGLSGADYFTIRTISILENCKNHPLFEEFVQIIINLDKNSLLVNQDTIEKYSNLIKDTSSTGTVVNQYGDKINNFRKFKTVQVINKLRNIVSHNLT